MRYDARKAPPKAGEAKRNGIEEAVGLRWLAVMVCPVPGRLDGRMAQSTDEIRIRRMASECDDMSVPVQCRSSLSLPRFKGGSGRQAGFSACYGYKRVLEGTP